MTIVEGRILQFPAAHDSNPVVRVDLKYLLTRERPYTRSYLNYLADELGVPDYGSMLCQQLRRIEGVCAVTITHYGCKVEIGALYDIREMTRKIRKTVEFVLWTDVPWTVERHNALNWSYRFARPLLYSLSGSLDMRYVRNVNPQELSTPDRDSRLTEFGQQLAVGLRSTLAQPLIAHRNGLNIKPTADQPDWEALDKEFDALAALVVGVRHVTVEWD